MAEPQCVEVVVSSSIGGKVQIVKFEYTEDFHFSQTRKYSIPEDWPEESVQQFTAQKTAELYDLIDEEFATPTVKRLMQQRDELE